MRVITEPTVLAEGPECDAIVEMMAGKAASDKTEARAVLQAVLQHAFEVGMGHSKPAERAKPVSLPETGPASSKATTVPPLKPWQDIKDESPENPIERFQLDQTPPPGSSALWESQLYEALMFAARKYD